MTAPTTIAQDNNRQAYLEALYLLDGRDKPDHPQHALYTSLYADRIAALLAADRDTLVGLQVTDDDDKTALYVNLSSYVGPGLIADSDAAAAVCSAWCRIVASRLSLAMRRLDPPTTGPSTYAVRSVQAVVDWLRHEAVRAELHPAGERLPGIDASPSSLEPVNA